MIIYIYGVHKYGFMENTGLDVMTHDCKPNTLGGQGGQITWGQEFETGLANMVNPQLY